MVAEIVIVDYKVGNLRSIVNALHRLGCDAEISCDKESVASAPMVILPGVGAAGLAMRELNELNLVATLRERAEKKKPILGVCLGMQLLMDTTEESGNIPCLGIVPGTVHRFPSGNKIPHMGWNQVAKRQNHSIFQGIPNNTDFYFVHSYFVIPKDDAIVLGRTKHGVNYCCAFAYNAVIATQFHPEKSGEMGLKIYENFIRFGRRGLQC
ncbi:MAG: imidazole glycerol phosphate synthase subunit HisH [Dehalococcoidia bacterium]|nr:imidazole glycerol phosphate synthase subunit HisH [Dehalococcoidia bacterium]